jgi:RNA polymerase sigma factor (sigma-70 family)
MALYTPAAAGVDDVDRLYRRLAGRLEQIVRGDVHAPDPIIEDACQVAWGRLIDHSDRVRRETALGWLAATAIHEAFRLVRRSRREVSLEATIEAAGEFPLSRPGPGPCELVIQRDRIDELARLPARQQRLLWLQGLGLSYVEMAAHERCTTRTIERQLSRARETLSGRGRACASGAQPG